jgi:hypothetical protein
MKTYARIAAILAALLLASPALAQQTAIHTVPIGKGAGNTGFNAAVPGAAGQPLVSQGATSDPAFGTIANSGFAAGAANTVKGSLNGTNVIDLPLPSCTGVNQAWRYVSGTGINCSNVSVTTGYDMPINLGLSATPSGNALTINVVQANGAAPTSANPVLVPFRATLLAGGTVTWATIASVQSITIPSGATLGTSNGVPFKVWIFEDYDGGTPELGVASCSNATTIFPCAAWESTLPTSVTIGGSSNSGGVLYSVAGVSAEAVRIVGFCEFDSGLTTAGAWASSCTTLQPFGPGVKKPGDVVQTLYQSTASTTNCNSTSLTVETALHLPITLASAANLVKIEAQTAQSGAGDTFVWQMSRGTTPTLIGQPGGGGLTSGPVTMSTALHVLDLPGVVGPTTYAAYCKFTGGSGFTDNGGTLTISEIQG